MALWMEAGSEPVTEKEMADLDAIAALKESAAVELKEQGNQYVKMGKKHYADAVDCYTRAINQNVLCDADASVLYSNRAHVNLLQGNYRRALTDAEQAIKLSQTNVKAHYRAAKASFSLNLLTEAASFCKSGLEQSPTNEELKKLALQIDLRWQEDEKHRLQVAGAVSAAKAGSGIPLSKKEILKHFLEGTAGARADNIIGGEENTGRSSEHIDLTSRRSFTSAFSLVHQHGGLID